MFLFFPVSHVSPVRNHAGISFANSANVSNTYRSRAMHPPSHRSLLPSPYREKIARERECSEWSSWGQRTHVAKLLVKKKRESARKFLQRRSRRRRRRLWLVVFTRDWKGNFKAHWHAKKHPKPRWTHIRHSKIIHPNVTLNLILERRYRKYKTLNSDGLWRYFRYNIL